MKTWGQVWRDADAEDRSKLVIAFVMFLFQLPVVVLFYFFRSAWNDAPMVSLWLRPKAICEHKVDRARRYCEQCDELDAARDDIAFSNAVHKN